MSDDLKERQRQAARAELKRRLYLQIYDYRYSLGHSTDVEALQGAVLCMGSIHELREHGLLTADEVTEAWALVRSHYAERQPEYLAEFDAFMERQFSPPTPKEPAP
jgi:hypothetical protein